MANTIRIKRGLKANLPALLAGELAYCNDTLELFVGRVNPGNGFTENILVNDIPDLSAYYTIDEIEALDGLGLVWNQSTDKFDADLALETDATTGTDNTKLMTPLRTTQAITAQTSGILTSGGYLDSDDFASQAEAETGTSETTIMSPLRTRESITEILADKAQAEAGSVNNRLMTPLRTAEAIAELSSAVTISTTEPANAKEGDLWWDSSDGTLYIYFDSNGTAIWVEVTFADQAVQLSDVLTRTNTDEYTPSADFHPATKKYVDDKVEHYNVVIESSPISAEETFVVTVQNVNGINVYFIDGVEKPVLDLVHGGVYTFDQSDSTNTNHPLRFRDSNDNAFTEGVVATGTAGTEGAEVVFTVPNDAPAELKYYCTVHGNAMGNTINVTSASASATGDWIEETTGAWEGIYIAEMTVNGLLATDQPVADLDFSDAGTATYEALQNDFGLIFRVIVTAENTIQFYASEVPAVALPINLKVVR